MFFIGLSEVFLRSHKHGHFSANVGLEMCDLWDWNSSEFFFVFSMIWGFIMFKCHPKCILAIDLDDNDSSFAIFTVDNVQFLPFVLEAAFTSSRSNSYSIVWKYTGNCFASTRLRGVSTMDNEIRWCFYGELYCFILLKILW